MGEELFRVFDVLRRTPWFPFAHQRPNRSCLASSGFAMPENQVAARGWIPSFKQSRQRSLNSWRVVAFNVGPSWCFDAAVLCHGPVVVREMPGLQFRAIAKRQGRHQCFDL